MSLLKINHNREIKNMKILVMGLPGSGKTYQLVLQKFVKNFEKKAGLINALVSFPRSLFSL